MSLSISSTTHLISPPSRDTVESAGLFQRSAPFSRSNDAIVHFRHALALDEHRVKFMPSFSTNGERASREPSEDEHGINVMTGPETNEEVFFAGVHCGTFWFCSQRIRHLRMSFQISGVDL